MCDDFEIVRRVQGGETQAFALLVEKYQRPLLDNSRAFGFVPLGDVVGKARQVYYSADNGSVRWSRIGTTL